MERRSVVRCRCVVVHAACIVDDPIGVYQIIQSKVVVFVTASIHFGFHPLVLIVISILPVASSFEGIRFALELYFSCLSFLYSCV